MFKSSTSNTWAKSGMAALVTSLMAAGCGGSSSDDEVTATEEDIAEVAVIATEMSSMFSELYHAMGDLEEMDDIFSAMSIDSTINDTEKTPSSSISRLSAKALDLAKPSSYAVPQQTETIGCGELTGSGSGSFSFSETTNGGSISFSNCRITEPHAGMSARANGSISVTMAGPAHGYTESVEVNFSSLSGSFSMGDASLAGNVNGNLNAFASSDNNARANMNFSFDMDAQCRGLSEGLGQTYDMVYDISPDGGSGMQLSMNGSVSMSGSLMDGRVGRYDIVTESPIRVDQWGNTYDGTMRMDFGGESVTVKYEQSGIYVNDQFYNWNEFEEHRVVDKRMDALEQCLDEELGGMI